MSAGKSVLKNNTNIQGATQLIRHSIFTRNMDVVMKAAQSVTKSNGVVAGAVVLLAGAIGAAVNAVQYASYGVVITYDGSTRSSIYTSKDVTH